MSCPYCLIEYDPRHWGKCPHCGGGDDAEPHGWNLENGLEVSGVMRTSTILIAAGNQHARVYRSVEEVPEPLRRQLEASTTGQNCGTIYIADQRGRERIALALRVTGSGPAPAAVNWQGCDEALAPVLSRFSASLPPKAAVPVRGKVPLATLWIGLIVMSVAGAVIWLVGGRAW